MLKKVDEIAEKKPEKFFAQIGNSIYEPKNIPFKRFLGDEQFQAKVDESDLIIGHAGAGLIITALSMKKKVIILPRMKEKGEHTDSHQVDIATFLAKKGKVITVFDENDIPWAIAKSGGFVAVTSNDTARIVSTIGDFVKKNA